MTNPEYPHTVARERAAITKTADCLGTQAETGGGERGMVEAFRVTLVHPHLEGPFIADVLASSATAAGRRVRVQAMHLYRHAELLDSTVTVLPITREQFNTL